MIQNDLLIPFNFKRIQDSGYLLTSVTGDFEFVSQENLRKIIHQDNSLDLKLYLSLKSKYFLLSQDAVGSKRGLVSRLHAKKSTVLQGPALHLIVVTIQCEHSCSYCQVSRQQQGDAFTMSKEQIIQSCNTIFQSKAQNITVEFQGGDPLLRYDLVKIAIEYLVERNRIYQKNLRFVITSTLHQLNTEMCNFFRQHRVMLSTSIDGVATLHNQNRPIAERNSFERTIQGLNLARAELGEDSISALMTTTRRSLAYAHEIVDAYVELGFHDIFIRSLSDYGFAKKNAKRLAPTLTEFLDFYDQALDRVIYWNQQGYRLVEVHAAILLNKILSPFDQGYVDLQSPSGAGLGCIVYNYDGYVYPSDEARMLKETGDTSLRLGTIGDSLETLLNSDVQKKLIAASLNFSNPSCSKCVYSPYCGHDPISAYNQFKTFNPPTHLTHHCQKYQGLFDLIFQKYQTSKAFRTLAEQWAFMK